MKASGGAHRVGGLLKGGGDETLNPLSVMRRKVSQAKRVLRCSGARVPLGERKSEQRARARAWARVLLLLLLLQKKKKKEGIIMNGN